MRLPPAFLETARTCAGCRGPGGPLCPRCLSTLLRGPEPVERGATLPCDLWAAATYAGPVREALVAFKDHGRWSLRPTLGTALAVAVAALVETVVLDLAQGYEDEVELPESLLLVPLPSAPDSVRRRDGAHVHEIAVHAARVLRGALPLVDVDVVDGLATVRRRRDQVGLGRAERAANLAGSMRATDRIVGRVPRRWSPDVLVVLVDDLVTTGATLAEGHRALLAAGVWTCGAAAVAATPANVGRPARSTFPEARAGSLPHHA